VTCRIILPRVGSQITVRTANPYDLPSGLSDGQIVTVIADGNAGVTVADESGRHFRVAIQCCDMPTEYFHKGRWLPESHPEILECLVAQIIDLETTRGRWPAGIERANDTNLECWRKILYQHMG
jgi:hypothetical protein